MATSKAAQVVTRQVRPILSLDHNESRRRALALYKAWYRQIPHTGKTTVTYNTYGIYNITYDRRTNQLFREVLK